MAGLLMNGVNIVTDLEITEDSENNATINEIIKPRFKVDNVDGILDDDTHIRFESIIEFPYFLLHALRVFEDFYRCDIGKRFGDYLMTRN